jgi:hypothetical protein
MRFEGCLDGLSIEVLGCVGAGQLGGHCSLCGKRGSGCRNGGYTQTQAKHCAAVHLCHPSRSLPAGLSVQGTAECRSDPPQIVDEGKIGLISGTYLPFRRRVPGSATRTALQCPRAHPDFRAVPPYNSKSGCQEKYIGTLPGGM